MLVTRVTHGLGLGDLGTPNIPRELVNNGAPAEAPTKEPGVVPARPNVDPEPNTIPRREPVPEPQTDPYERPDTTCPVHE